MHGATMKKKYTAKYSFENIRLLTGIFIPQLQKNLQL